MELREIIYDKSFTLSDKIRESINVEGQVTYRNDGGFDLMLYCNDNTNHDMKAEYSYSVNVDGYVTIQYRVSQTFKDEFISYVEKLIKELLAKDIK